MSALPPSAMRAPIIRALRSSQAVTAAPRAGASARETERTWASVLSTSTSAEGTGEGSAEEPESFEQAVRAARPARTGTEPRMLRRFKGAVMSP